jgi:hypothetical protein
MKYLSIFLIMLLIGMAGAQSTWYPRSADYNTTGDVNAADGTFTGSVSVAGVVTATGGTVNGGVYDGNFRLAAGHGFYSTAGAGFIDFSNATGIFSGPTGAYSVNGNGTVASTKSWAITTADKLTVGGVIVPQEMVLTIPIGASEVDQTAFIADDAWQITKIEEVHTVAQNTAYPNTGNLSINKCTGTQAPNAGAHLHNTTMWLNSTINTVATPTLNAATGALNLADGNRICLDFNGTMTTFAGGVVTIHLKRV